MDHLTSAEYRTLREACGLSQQAAATFHNVSLRTINHWEEGRNNIPDGAARELLGLNATIERGVENALTLVGELAGQHGEPDVIALTRYRTAADYANSRAASEGLPWPCHNALTARTMTALERIGARVTISWG
jgi:transcriptional regulator with XRE-family HTH domain